MSFDPSRADLVIQYALLLAGEEDDFLARQLGPIHLIKYAYLADLHFAQRHAQSFTGADWHFHDFGPWDTAVYERVAPATSAIHAEQTTNESAFGGEDWVRYRLRDSELLSRIEKSIPAVITLHLRHEVHRFLGDTPSLLDYVYKTKPMLCAAPRERLDLSAVASTNAPLDEGDSGLRMDVLSNKKKKRFHDALNALRTKEIDRPRLIDPVKAPRFDDVYQQGLEWLDELAGEPELGESEWIAEFSDDVWKSASRKGGDVS